MSTVRLLGQFDAAAAGLGETIKDREAMLEKTRELKASANKTLMGLQQFLDAKKKSAGKNPNSFSSSNNASTAAPVSTASSDASSAPFQTSGSAYTPVGKK